MNTGKFSLKQEDISWKIALTETASKYHIVGSWVAVIFNILFTINDYLNVNEHWQIFFMVRLAVSSITFLALVLRKPFNFSSEILIFIPFFLISVQNAFMWSYMDAPHFLKHTLAYIALFIGAGMLILWEMQFSILVVALSILANVFFLSIFSQLSLEQIMVNGGLLTTVVAIFSIILIQTRYKLNKKEIISRLALKASNEKLNRQNAIIEEKTSKIEDSIRYAKRIQEALLPTKEILEELIPDYFIFFRPKDIVSGDFYWFGKQDTKVIVAAVDCTGHGVPGAFMSMIGNTLLNKLVGENRYIRPAKILFELRKGVIKSLGQSGNSQQKDGMDIALCMIDRINMKIEFAGAHNPLFLIRNKQLTEIKGNRMPIGKYYKKEETPFDNHELAIEKGDMLYVFTDGYMDQFGKELNKKFSKRKLKELLVAIAHLPVTQQENAVRKAMDSWQQDKEQLDDMLIIGIKI